MAPVSHLVEVAGGALLYYTYPLGAAGSSAGFLIRKGTDRPPSTILRAGETKLKVKLIKTKISSNVKLKKKEYEN